MKGSETLVTEHPSLWAIGHPAFHHLLTSLGAVPSASAHPFSCSTLISILAPLRPQARAM